MGNKKAGGPDSSFHLLTFSSTCLCSLAVLNLEVLTPPDSPRSPHRAQRMEMGTQRTKTNLQPSAGSRTTTAPQTWHWERRECYFTRSREMTKGEMLQVFTWLPVVNFIWEGRGKKEKIIKDLVRQILL